MWNFIKQIYYRCRIKRRLKEVKTGKRCVWGLCIFKPDPISPDELMEEEADYFAKQLKLN